MNKKLTNVETEIKLFDKLSESKNHTQRSISKDLGVALGVANALIKKLSHGGGHVPKSAAWTLTGTFMDVEESYLLRLCLHDADPL